MSTTLRVKEIFPTLQGEGSQAGTPSVFIRLSACNLWSGHNANRSTGKGACARWCDTDFVGGDAMAPADLVNKVLHLCSMWQQPHVTITGGEPGLQLRRPAGEKMIELLQVHGVEIAVETNGTIDCSVFRDESIHVTCSPKMLFGSTDVSHIVLPRCTDLKIVVPQWPEASLRSLTNKMGWKNLYFQPLDEPMADHLPLAMRLAELFGARVSIQSHKYVGLP